MSSLAQQALDISVNAQIKIVNGVTVEKNTLIDMCAAIQLLAQSALGATPSGDVVGDGLTMTDVSATSAVDTPTT